MNRGCVPLRVEYLLSRNKKRFEAKVLTVSAVKAVFIKFPDPTNNATGKGETEKIVLFRLLLFE